MLSRVVVMSEEPGGWLVPSRGLRIFAFGCNACSGQELGFYEALTPVNFWRLQGSKIAETLPAPSPNSCMSTGFCTMTMTITVI